ncbi:MAG TPA: ABC transporter ATP-binding protein [Candidatus Methylomirabilis sp.]|nr:ABC transporter ATP-binding protein [Candidatus Methylomirabilis sp.]
MILQVETLVAGYGSSVVVHGISLTVGEGEIVCLLGRNGAGKTTTLRCIMGLTPSRSGSIRFKGREVAGRQPFEIARLGIGYVPDDRRIFPDLTVEENLEIARRTAAGTDGRWTAEKVYDLFPVLRELRASRGNHLSGGEQKMLAIGRALMKSPDLLLLDEPVEGLAPLVVRHLVEVLGEIRAGGVTILLADQNLKFCRKLAGRGYIMEKGLIQHAGSLEVIWQNEEVVRQYLAL